MLALCAVRSTMYVNNVAKAPPTHVCLIKDITTVVITLTMTGTACVLLTCSSAYNHLKSYAESSCSCHMQADSAASLKAQPKHTKLDEIQEEIQMQAPDAK